jgi:hypothetical protein
MKGYIVDGFYYKISKINILQQETIFYCEKVEHYIKHFVDYIKENIIRKFKNLNLLEIEINTLNKNKIFHRFIVTISNMIRDLLNQKEKINLYDTLCIIIKYDNNIEFIGSINFTGIC